jgi:hypothetical protein
MAITEQPRVRNVAFHGHGSACGWGGHHVSRGWLRGSRGWLPTTLALAHLGHFRVLAHRIWDWLPTTLALAHLGHFGVLAHRIWDWLPTTPAHLGHFVQLALLAKSTSLDNLAPVGTVVIVLFIIPRSPSQCKRI